MASSVPQLSISPADPGALRPFPDPITLLILSKLDDIRDLRRCALTCRSWMAIANEPKLVEMVLRRTRDVTIIDEPVWRRGFELPEEIVFDPPPQDPDLLFKVCRALSWKIEGNAGVTVLTMPRNLTFLTLERLAQAPLQGEAAKFQHREWPEFRERFGNDAIRQTYRIVLTNNVLNDSRSKFVNVQKALVQSLALGARLPRTLEVATQCIMRFVATGQRLYANKPPTYTRCEENVYRTQVIVGGFSARGLNITPNWVFEDLGAGAALELDPAASAAASAARELKIMIDTGLGFVYK